MPQSPSVPSIQHALALQRQGRLSEAEGLCASVLARRPGDFAASCLLGVLKMQRGQPAQALPLIERAVKIKPRAPEAITILGAVLAALGRRTDALAAYERLVKLRPGDPEALYNQGAVLTSLGRHADALASYEKALTIRRDHVPSLFNKAHALVALQHFERARTAYDALIAVAPDHVAALTDRGNLLARLGRRAEALASFDKALAVSPAHVNALSNRGNLLNDEGRHEEALAMHDRALSVDPRHVPSLSNRGNVLVALNRPVEAVASFDRALALAPDDSEILFNRACALERMHRFEDALADLDRSLARGPDSAKALHNRGNVLAALGRPEEAIASYTRALALEPDRADTLHNRGNVRMTLNRHTEAIADYEHALALEPANADACAALTNCRLRVCDWENLARLAERAQAAACEGDWSRLDPFAALCLFDDPGDHLEYARAYVRRRLPVLPRPLEMRTSHRRERIRIAYLSSDFRNHPIAHLTSELYERHDRGRFEVIGISFGPDDKSEARARLIRAFDGFHDVRSMSDAEAAAFARGLAVDIAIDLNGHTAGARLGLLARRPAPVQAQYLGYLGTTGAEFIDYVIGDEIVLPLDQQAFYTEKFAHLSECFQICNSPGPAPSHVPCRAELGLPEDAVVFCCFNNTYKIMPDVFDRWMRLLKSIDGSVFWLYGANAPAMENLRRAAESRGVDPARLVFAPGLPLAEYRARLSRADLFLDTLPYNAGATANDALAAGLPIVTCAGHGFAGRMGASLLRAIGLPELITTNLDDYEALSLKLASDRPLLESIRRRLARNRETCALFDVVRTCRHIEAAYAAMWEIHLRGESPRGFRVEPN